MDKQYIIFGGAYVRREICVSKSIRLTLQLEVNIPFLFCFTSYSKAIFQVQAPGGVYLERQFNGGFFALPVWGGLIFGGAYTWRGLFSKFYGMQTKGVEFPRIFFIMLG